MRIEPIRGEKWRFYVHSESKDDETHIVDLTANGGIGECSCPDWTFRKFPHWRKTDEIVECKHISAAMMFEMRRLMRAANEPSKPKAVTVKDTKDGLPF